MIADAEQCRLCNCHTETHRLLSDESVYYNCHNCGLIFQKREQLPHYFEEKKRYLEHNNDVLRQDYLNYLKESTKRIFELPISKKSLLDYGCGPAKGLEHIWSKDFEYVASFDPIFHKLENFDVKSFDVICCVEVIEHFYSPATSFEKIDSLLSKNGFVLFRTEFLDEMCKLDNWWYRKDPTHVCFYNSQTWKYIEKKFSWKLVLEEDSRYAIFQKS
ncbi:MAG: class I SAM-dependent methyltransferase [Bdellovibrionota bacterium]|nr:class I SAM-dependent methyltransferase [Bdellovibrionota bacterium]